MQRPSFASRLSCYSLAHAVLLGAGTLCAQVAVSPSDRGALEGSSFTHFPLGRPNARFQFLHADLPPGMVVHGHAFRRDASQVRGVVDGFAADLEVTLSIARTTPASASATFANNAGLSPTVVLPRTTLVFPATDRPALDPAPAFDLVVPYSVPFVLPATPSTLCVDTVMYGNTSAAGVDRQLSIYLDSHDLSTSSSEQPGFRTGTGCAAGTSTTAATATMSLWHLGTSMRLDLAARNGLPDNGTGQSFCLLAFGAAPTNLPWPFRPQCVLQASVDEMFVLGTNDLAGNYDGGLTNQPLLPPGLRIYLQAGSLAMGSLDLVVTDLTTLVTPGAPPSSLPATRVSASTNRLATTGTVTPSVPVTQFF